MNQAQRNQPSAQAWTPMYTRWRHGGWYVRNIQYPSGACGCVSNNYDDKKWRIACDNRRRALGEPGDVTFRTRDEAARAEYKLVQELIAEQALEAVLRDAHGFERWEGSPVTGSHLPSGVHDATQVVVIFRNGQRHTGCAQAFGWNHSGYNPQVQIVAYQALANA